MSYRAVDLGLLPGGSFSIANNCSSATGSVVVGQADDASGDFRAVYWDGSNQIHALPGLATHPFDQAFACSSDGTVIVGQVIDNGGLFHAVTWTGGPSWVVNDLGFLPGGNSAIARGCSSNGGVVVGSSTSTASPGEDVPCVWSSGSVAPLPPFATAGDAQCCSSDGTIIFGGSDLAYKWTGGPAWAATALQLLSGGGGGPVACSSDGAISVGIASDSGNVNHAAFWTGTVLTVLSDPLAVGSSLGLGCDATGTVISGQSNTGAAALWVSGTGQLLPVPSSLSTADQALGVCANGTVVVGFGLTGGGSQHAIKWTNTPLIWFRHNTGAWLPSGDPATLTGGISLGPLDGIPLFATVQGTGDAGITLNAGASPFSGVVPLGYTSGLPHSGGGFTTLDPSKVFGSASLSGGNLSCGFPTTPGMAQTVDGYTTGKYYFELKNPTGDIFSAEWGGGVAKDFTGSGNLSFWIPNGGYNVSDNNGGALVAGQSLVHELSSLGALNVQVLADAFNFALGSGDVIGVALFLSGSAVTLSATLADLFFAATTGFVDFTAQANRRQFINVNGGAQNLQADGSGPYAVTPPVFLSLEGTSAPNTFAQNKGRGGNFVITGPDLTAGPTNPPSTTETTETVAGTVPFSGVLGDYLTGNIYAFNPDTLTDNGTPRKWVRRWRALPGETTSAVTYSYLAISMRTGIEVPPGTKPQMVLRWSDDGGKTWSGNRIIPVGPTGATAFTVKANRLGSTSRFAGSTRMFELSSTDPFKVALVSAEVLTK